MKKTVTIGLSVFFVLVLAYVGGCYYLGGQALKSYNQAIAQINGSKDLKASTVSCQRGIFSSRALTRITLVLPRKTPPISFELVDTIYQGPFVFLHGPHFKGGLRPVLAVIRTRPAPGADLKNVLEEVPELASSEMLTVLSIDGSAASYLDIPSFQHKFPDDKGGQMEVEYGGLTGQFNFDARLAKAVCFFNFPSLLVTQQGHRLEIESVRGRFASHPGIKGISVGSTAVSIGAVESVENGHSLFTLASFGLKAQSRVVEDKINGSIRLDFAKLNAGGLGLGPFSMELEARKLDAGVLAGFQRLAPVLQREEMANDEAAKDEIRGLLAKMAADLLARRPEFEIKQLDLRTDKGDLTGKARLGFDNDGEDLSRNILALLMSMDASAEFSVSQTLFYFVAQNVLSQNSGPDSNQAKAAARQLVARLLASKYMIAEAGAFKSNAALKHGILTVNGLRLGF